MAKKHHNRGSGRNLTEAAYLAARREETWSMHSAGRTVVEIAEALGVSTGVVYSDLDILARGGDWRSIVALIGARPSKRRKLLRAHRQKPPVAMDKSAHLPVEPAIYEFRLRLRSVLRQVDRAKRELVQNQRNKGEK
jgi:hypothetical protein